MGGNVFAGKTASIKLEHIEPTLVSYFAELQQLFPLKSDIFNSQHFVSLGSVGKKPISGDIDLGISDSDILDSDMSDASIMAWNIDPAAVAKETVELQRRARTATPTQSRMKAFMKTLTVYINAHAPTLYCDEKKVGAGTMFGLYPQFDVHGRPLGTGVQIDWMVGDLDWLRFSYYSAAYAADSNVKGLHRTQLMLAAFQVADLSFNHVSGVKDKHTGQVVANKPGSALTILGNRLGFEISQSVTEDYYQLHLLFQTKMRSSDYDQMIDTYFKILDSTRADIPDNLQSQWMDRQGRLGLTGKFLPETSALLVTS